MSNCQLGDIVVKLSMKKSSSRVIGEYDMDLMIIPSRDEITDTSPLTKNNQDFYVFSDGDNVLLLIVYHVRVQSVSIGNGFFDSANFKHFPKNISVISYEGS